MCSFLPQAAAHRGRPHAALPERRADNWEVLHTAFCREAKEAGVLGRSRCRVLFLGDSITEAMRGTQFAETYDELKPRQRCGNMHREAAVFALPHSKRHRVFEAEFSRLGARAFGISGDRTQHLLWRLQNGELNFRRALPVVSTPPAAS